MEFAPADQIFDNQVDTIRAGQCPELILDDRFKTRNRRINKQSKKKSRNSLLSDSKPNNGIDQGRDAVKNVNEQTMTQEIDQDNTIVFTN